MKNKSKIGLGLVILYILFLAYAIFAEASCSGWGCGYFLYYAGFPSILLFIEIAKIMQSQIFIWIVAIACNIGILYLLGAGISKFINKKNNV